LSRVYYSLLYDLKYSRRDTAVAWSLYGGSIQARAIRIGEMIFSMSIDTSFSTIHAVLNLIGIVSGVIVVKGMLNAIQFDDWTGLFFATTAATAITGYFLPSHESWLSSTDDAIRLIIIAVSTIALWHCQLEKWWRWTYIVSSVITLYLNSFVGIVQIFEGIQFLGKTALMKYEMGTVYAQAALLAYFIILMAMVIKSVYPEPKLSLSKHDVKMCN
jgi:hypothetical protein